MVGDQVIVVTERDRALCAEVARFGALTREQAVRLGFFRSRTRANERLKKLSDAGYLAIRSQAVSQRGVRFVYLPGRHLETAGRTRSRLAYSSELFVDHQLGLVDARIAFERHTTLSRWWTDKELAAISLNLIPDAFVEFSHRGHAFAAFIEYDRGTETLARFEQKVRAYLDLAFSGRFERTFNRKFFRLLILTDSVRRLTTLSHMVAKITDRVARFSTLDEMTQHGPMAPIWRRSGASTLEPLTPA